MYKILRKITLMRQIYSTAIRSIRVTVCYHSALHSGTDCHHCRRG